MVTGDSNFVNWMYEQGILLAIIGVLVWTTSLWTTNNSELYSNSLYTGPAINAMGGKVRRKTIVLIVGVLGTILGSAGFYQLFFADFINILGAAFVPLAGPIIADYYWLRRGEYAPEGYNRQAAVRWPGIISFLLGAACGLLFQYVWPLPGGFSASIAALIVTLVVHVILHFVMGGAGSDAARTPNHGKAVA